MKIATSNITIKILTVCFLIGVITACSRPNNDNLNVTFRDCKCPMVELIDSSLKKEKDSTSLKTDFYDWSVEGSIGGAIKQIINAEISTSNRTRKSKYEVSTSEIINEIRSDYPELIDENFQFKLKRITFCTYHDLICNDTTLTDSIYRSLILQKLTEFENEIDKLFEGGTKELKGKSTREIPPAASNVDNRQIKANIYTENQSGGINTVNITSSVEYKKLSFNIIKSIRSNLRSFKERYGIGDKSWIIIKAESGSSMRRKLAMDLDSLLTFDGNDWAFFGENNVNMGNHPEYPISVFYHPRVENVVKDLVSILKEYIEEGFELRADNNHTVNTVDLYINGTPNFNEAGQVKVE